MRLVGLTGGIGSGKSTVASLLAARGAVIVDADAIVREIQAPGGLAYQGIVDRFGPGVVAADGTLDRPALAAIVFNDEAARRDLNALTHPLVGRVMFERIAANAGTDKVVVLDIPLLAERGGKGAYPVAGVIVVDTPVDVAVERLVRHRGFDEDDARARVASQISRDERLAIADFVVDNGGAPDALDEQIDRCWAWIATLPEAEIPAAT
ncbi:MAG TPA: dephospho-CoA kinase [Acidimicrobiales bacterium]|nr:dephospho-CoA kinase [Acidimicrobiales bacterium]